MWHHESDVKDVMYLDMVLTLKTNAKYWIEGLLQMEAFQEAT